MTKSDSTRRAGWKALIVVMAVSLFVAILLAEVVMRLMGFEPWQPVRPWVEDANTAHEQPLMTYPHPVRGWANQPGLYEYDGFSAEVERITVNVAADESRRTQAEPPAPNAGNPAIVFVGGSNTYGWAISDWETFPWKLQQRYPGVAIHNLGVPGYGTLQSLQVLEEKLPHMTGRKLVFYGLIGHHFSRNVLDPNWTLLFAVPGKGQMPPYVTLDGNDQLQRHPPERWRTWPLKDKLALVNAAETAFLRYSARPRARQRYAAMYALLGEMQATVQAHGGELVVVMLKVDRKRAGGLEWFMADAKLPYLKCMPDEFGPELRVKGEGHPNDQLNSQWADCIAAYLDEKLDRGFEMPAIDKQTPALTSSFVVR